MKLSVFFTLEELTASDFAERNGIDNTPPPEALENLRRLAQILDLIRTRLGHPMVVNSGFRCEQLERELTRRDFAAWCAKRNRPVSEESWKLYFERKAHPKGLAADFVCPGFGTPLEICREIQAAGFVLDQLIYEYTWVHAGLAPELAQPRGEVLTLIPGGGYAQGIVERTAVA